MLYPNRFLTRLQAPADVSERLRIEHVLAGARILLVGAALAAIYLDPTEPAHYASTAYAVLVGYLAYSLLVWWLMHVRPHWLAPSWLHIVDVLLPAVFTVFTQGPNSPFFLYFVFVLITAALRWGFPETIATAGAIFLLVVGEALIVGSAPWALVPLMEGAYDLNRLLIRITFMLVLGVLLGYLAEQEKELRAESVVIGRVLGSARPELGLRGSMQQVMSELLRVFRSPRAVVCVEHVETGRAFVWQARMEGGSVTTEAREATADQREPLPLSCDAHSFHAEQRNSRWRVWTLNADGERMSAPECTMDSRREAALPRAVTSVSFSLGGEWSGRLMLYDAATSWDRAKELRFAQALVRHAGPALYAVYLLRRLRSRAGAMERARVARELHDGTIQALISVEMQVDVLRRQAANSSHTAPFSAELAHVQRLLREQVLELRALMQQMRSVELAPGQLLDYLANLVDRFRRDTGMSAQFVSELEDIDLTPHVCREVARIVQEALINIRKHSGASQVLVRFGMHSGHWRLVIEDNGQGFDFMGRLALADLDAAHKGPVVIKERVRTIGGTLSIESLPGRGAHLEITFPPKTQLAHA